jgi:AraC-like DNA-binding protein
MQPQYFARYREYHPCPALRAYIRCFFTFAAPAQTDHPRRHILRERTFESAASCTTPLFADSHVSLSFSFGLGYRIDGLWTQAEQRSCGHVIGPMSAAHPAAHGDRIIEVGVYFRPMHAKSFFMAHTHELTDRILPLSDLWGQRALSLESAIGEARTDDQRVDQLEHALLQRLRISTNQTSAVNLQSVAAFIHHSQGNVTVAQLAQSAGISRQHLARLFHEEAGISPKLFCRLARFRAALTHAGSGAALAADLGYVDQSHMIAEFREFSGLTPKPILSQERVHPFAGTHPSDRKQYP